MHTMLARPFHPDGLADISPGPLTITEGLTFTHLGKQVNKGVTIATETQATAAPHGGILTTTGKTDATTLPRPQLPPARLEHRPDCELTHAPWAGWYCETAADRNRGGAHIFA